MEHAQHPAREWKPMRTVAAFLLLSIVCPLVNAEALPKIDLWYGDRQSFGPAGHPQPLINVLGSVDPVAQVADATFRVNKGRGRPIVFGPDLHRLARSGDFNLEIDRSSLKDGENTVQIRLRTPTGVLRHK